MQDCSTHDYSRLYVKYVMLLIFLVAMFNVCDRTIIAVLVDDIKADLLLNDRQMGFVMGLAFSITYFLAGIPLARLADNGSRKRIISCALLVWSVMTSLTGLAQNFVQLVICRMGVGIGEAGGSPPSHSLIVDYVEKSHRARAMAILTIGALIGGGFGVAFGGWAGTQFGWRMALIIIGIPGIFLGVLFYLTVKEPPRRPSPSDRRDTGGNLVQTLRALSQIPPFVYMTAAASFVALVGTGRQFWEPTFMRRVYDLSAQDAGLAYMMISIVPSAIGAYYLASLMDRLSKRDRRWYAWTPAICISISIPFSLLFYFSSPESTVMGIPTGFLYSGISSLFVAVWAPATMTLAQSVVPSDIRAVSAATWSLISGLVGAGLGPLIIGDLNTRFEEIYGTDAIRYSLSFIAILAVSSTVLYLIVARKLIDESDQVCSTE